MPALCGPVTRAYLAMRVRCLWRMARHRRAALCALACALVLIALPAALGGPHAPRDQPACTQGRASHWPCRTHPQPVP